MRTVHSIILWIWKHLICFPINEDMIVDKMKFVKENDTCKILSYKGSVFDIEPPNIRRA